MSRYCCDKAKEAWFLWEEDGYLHRENKWGVRIITECPYCGAKWPDDEENE